MLKNGQKVPLLPTLLLSCLLPLKFRAVDTRAVDTQVVKTWAVDTRRWTLGGGGNLGGGY